jgi:hypothetical protein
MWGQNPNQNYSYPQQSMQPHPHQNPNQSRIPMNPGVALLGVVGQNTIQQNRGAYQGYNYNQPQAHLPYGQSHAPQQQMQQSGYQGQNWGGYQMSR